MNKEYSKIKYASIGELSIAYQVWGDSDKVLVYVPGLVSHLEVTLEIRGYVDWLKNLSKNYKVIIPLIPITKIDGKVVGNGKVGEITQTIIDLYWEKHNHPDWTEDINDLL